MSRLRYGACWRSQGPRGRQDLAVRPASRGQTGRLALPDPRGARVVLDQRVRVDPWELQERMGLRALLDRRGLPGVQGWSIAGAMRLR